MWDDRYLSNGDFACLYPFFTKQEINNLEQKFLELIQYQVTIKVSAYTKFYCDLRALDKDNTVFFVPNKIIIIISIAVIIMMIIIITDKKIQ